MSSSINSESLSSAQSESCSVISTLPTELLSLIFEQCFLEFLQEKEYEPDLANPPWYGDGLTLTPWLKPISCVNKLALYKSNRRFPYSLVFVCRLWMNILSTRPEYWQEAILSYDPRSPTCGHWPSFLKWSRTLMIDVVVVAKNTDNATLFSDLEVDFMETVMSTLHPRIFRCRSLNIETDLSRAVPSIIQHIPVIPALRSLSMSSRSGGFDSRDSLESMLGNIYRDTHRQSIRELKSLELEGDNLRHVWPTWLSQQSNLQHLVISNHPRSSYGPTLVQLLRTLDNLTELTRLKFSNVEFDTRTASPGPTNISLGIEELCLEDVSPRFMRELFNLCDFDDVEHMNFTRCLIDDIPSCEMLSLIDVRTTADLSEVMNGWDGSHLWIGNCRMFNDNFFDMLRAYDWESQTFNCHWLQGLFLRDLPTFSLKKLKKMIKRRNDYIQYDDPHWKTSTNFGPAIRTLYIHNCGIADLTDQDVEWFMSHVVEFIYIKSQRSSSPTN